MEKSVLKPIQRIPIKTKSCQEKPLELRNYLVHNVINDRLICQTKNRFHT